MGADDHSIGDLALALTSEDGVPGYVRLASSLLAVEAWLKEVGLLDLPEMGDFLEHLWEWPLLGPDSSDAWSRGGGRLLHTALGGGTAPELKATVKAAGVKFKTFRFVLNCPAALVYDNLWFEGDLEDSARFHHEALRDALKPWGIVPPEDLEPIRGGVTHWGSALTEDEVASWRRVPVVGSTSPSGDGTDAA